MGMSCFACGERGAAINCQEKGCSRSFHLPCASEKGCVTQFFKAYRSFCSEHRPEQAVPVRPDAHTTCIICMELVNENLSSGTMVCPSCKGAWFHRGRIQGQATSAGRECFRCPQCKNKRKFLPEMLKMGILVPFRPPAWEEDGRYEELYERHSQCDGGQCLHQEGRQQAEESGPWELLLCSSCAPKGTHRRCSAVATNVDTWECDGPQGTARAVRPRHQQPARSGGILRLRYTLQLGAGCGQAQHKQPGRIRVILGLHYTLLIRVGLGHLPNQQPGQIGVVFYLSGS